jgi:dolichol-phosphate mannosyltransferase
VPDHSTLAVREDRRAAFPRTIPPAPKLTVLVPTRNEAANIEELLRRISTAVADLPTGIVFIDDSDDDTPQVIRVVARRGGGGACQVSLIHRQGDQRVGGLGGAVLDGLRTVSAPWACVLDADLQHPPEVIPMLLAKAEREGADLVVASRYREEGRPDGLGPVRTLISGACTTAAKLLFSAPLREVTDPMSGFFLVRPAALDLDGLQPRGFKILLELLVRSRGLRSTEIGFTFADRHAGESKGSLREGLSYFRLLSELRMGRGRAPSPPVAGAAAAELLVPLTQKTRV